MTRPPAPAAARTSLWLWLQYALVLVLAVALLAMVRQRREGDLDDAHRAFAAEAAAHAHAAAHGAETGFHHLNQGLRTIARLASLRTIARHGENLGAGDKTAIQEIYNNLVEDVAISEVYIVPVDFAPGAIDPVMRRLQEPIIIFDHLIVGRNADESASGGEGGETGGVEAEETVIHEYRELRRQLDALQTKHPTIETIRGLDYPAIASPELVTCDSCFFSPSRPNEALAILDDETQKIDLIVSDVLMPQMSGFRFADLARSLRQSIDVLFVSGQPERGDDVADLIPKDAKILSKPFDRNQLSAALNELLAAKIAA